MNSEMENPYAAPLSYDRGDALTEFYRIDLRGMTYREVWQITCAPLPFLILATMKILRRSGRGIFNTAIPRITRLDIVSHDQVPREVWDAWREGLQTCAANHMPLSFAHRIPTVGSRQTHFHACLLSDDEMTSATCTYVRVRKGRIDRVTAGYAVSSMLADGRYATTSGILYGFWNNRQVVVNRIPGASMAMLLEAHKRWIPTLDQPIVRMERSRHAERVLEATRALFDDMVRRKVYVPLTEKEYESIVRLSELPDAPAPPPETRVDRILRSFMTGACLLAAACWLYAVYGNHRQLRLLATLLMVTAFGIAFFVRLSRRRLFLFAGRR